eukprot:GEZU01026972.1.p1 GENE.GEZU01026972.1~~GEZU01026972.1.p1  ORF type:complete len:403 (-),score=88.31 GEZU01026972.1:920-2128(-)
MTDLTAARYAKFYYPRKNQTLEKTSSELQRVNSELRSLRDEHEETVARYNKLMQDKQTLEHKLQESEQKVEAYIKETDARVEALFDNLIREKRVLEDQSIEFAEDLEAINNKIKGWDSELAKFKDTNTAYADMQREADKYRADSEMIIVDQQNKLTKLEKELASWDSNYRTLNDEHQKSKKEIAALKEKINTLTMELREALAKQAVVSDPSLLVVGATRTRQRRNTHTNSTTGDQSSVASGSSPPRQITPFTTTAAASISDSVSQQGDAVETGSASGSTGSTGAPARRAPRRSRPLSMTLASTVLTAMAAKANNANMAVESSSISNSDSGAAVRNPLLLHPSAAASASGTGLLRSTSTGRMPVLRPARAAPRNDSDAQSWTGSIGRHYDEDDNASLDSFNLG